MGKRSQSGSLVDAVIKSLPARIHGNAPWYERLRPEHLSELVELKAAWKSGRLAVPRRTAARHIAAQLRERGISTVGMQGVDEWLKRD
jgi:hypothetical protein